MKKVVLLFVLAAFSKLAFGDHDVFVEGYYRSDGTYVRPHIRKSPDDSKSNNYGPSRRDDELMNPQLRDSDRDGIPNFRDYDSDNDGVPDSTDAFPYNPQK